MFYIFLHKVYLCAHYYKERVLKYIKIGVIRLLYYFSFYYLCKIESEIYKFTFKAMFENLSDRLERSFKILKGEGKITEINVAETLKDVRRALLDADVNYKVAKSFTDTVKQKALGMNVLTAVKPGQLMVKIVHDELAELMGGIFI